MRFGARGIALALISCSTLDGETRFRIVSNQLCRSQIQERKRRAFAAESGLREIEARCF